MRQGKQSCFYIYSTCHISVVFNLNYKYTAPLNVRRPSDRSISVERLLPASEGMRPRAIVLPALLCMLKLDQDTSYLCMIDERPFLLGMHQSLRKNKKKTYRKI